MLHSLLLKKINDKRIDLPNNDYIVSFYESLMQDNKFSKMSKKLHFFLHIFRNKKSFGFANNAISQYRN